ncbi:MAG: hypothetical protein HY939_01735 [Gammaproteobacteria bacterium]|nr:hypothetical protein [Gammaproteobacteria bacterium]
MGVEAKLIVEEALSSSESADKGTWAQRIKKFFSPPDRIKIGSKRHALREIILAEEEVLPALERGSVPQGEFVKWGSFELNASKGKGAKLKAAGRDTFKKPLYNKAENAFIREVIKAFYILSNEDGEDEKTAKRHKDEVECRARRRLLPELSENTFSESDKKARFEALLEEEKNKLKEAKKKGLDEQVSEDMLVDFLTRTGSTAIYASEKGRAARENYLRQADADKKKAEQVYEDAYQTALQLSERKKAMANAIRQRILKVLDDKETKKKIEDEAFFTLSKFNKVFYVIGKIFALIFALGCACATAGMLLIVFPAIPLVIPVFVFLGGFSVNYALSSKNTPSVFAYLFNMFKGLSALKRAALGVGFFMALATGAVAGVFAYTGAISILTALGVTSAAFPPLFAFVAVVSVLVLTAVMLRGMVSASKGHVGEKFVDFFKNLFKRRLVPRCVSGEVENHQESDLRYGLRMAFTALFFVGFFVVACLGCALNVYSGFQTISEMLMKLHEIPLLVCQGISMAVAAFSFLGEVKFHSDTAKDNAKTLTNDVLDIIRRAKEAWRGERYVNKSKIVKTIIVGVVLLKFLFWNVIGNVFPAAKGSGAALGALAGAESFADTFREYMEFIETAVKEVNKFFRGIKASIQTFMAKRKAQGVPNTQDEGTPPSPQGGDNGNNANSAPPSPPQDDNNGNDKGVAVKTTIRCIVPELSDTVDSSTNAPSSSSSASYRQVVHAVREAIEVQVVKQHQQKEEVLSAELHRALSLITPSAAPKNCGFFPTPTSCAVEAARREDRQEPDAAPRVCAVA